jgi:hypothetical protein
MLQSMKHDSKRKQFLTIVLILTYGFSGFSQGCVFDPADAALFPVRSRIKNLGSKEMKSFKELCPEVGDQGKCKSSVSWALGYYGLTLSVQRKKQKQKETKQFQSYFKENPFSPYFIWEEAKHSEQGLSLEDGFAVIEKYREKLEAIPTLKKQHNEPNCDKMGTVVGVKSKPLAKLYQSDATLTVEAQKAAIDSLFDHLVCQFNRSSHAKPIILIMRYEPALKTLNSDVIEPSANLSNSTEYHAVCIIGYSYDRSNPKVDAIEIVNSWGKKWGDKGFAWIKRKDIHKVVAAVYLMELE